MAIRIISALVAIPILILVVFLGGDLLLVACMLLSLIGLYEFYRAFTHIGINSINIIGYIATVFYYINLGTVNSEIFTRFILFMFVVLSLGINVFSGVKTYADIFTTISGFFYISFFLSHIYLVTTVDTNHFFIWLVFILAFVSDTFAYFTGYFFGKTKLIPDVSPKKTVEGAIGGVIMVIIVCVIYSMIFKPDFMLYSIGLGFVGSILSQIGDLIASKIKRQVDIKDFGNIMPGHGGVMDRFDSIMLTGPIVYYFVIFYMTYFA